ncbi:DUF751 family protein [Scytonema tolypothrichoides VB-61278]|jgi:hypothetical protein|nr:DUF751 family protein [Scytonema tolypothrichoides VB-61278]
MFDGFWKNIGRYARYFITTLLGVVLNAYAPLIPLFKRPITLIPILGFFLGTLVFITLTLRAMLGLSTI